MPRWVVKSEFVPSVGAIARTDAEVSLIADWVVEQLVDHRSSAIGAGDRLTVEVRIDGEVEEAARQGHALIHDTVTNRLPDWRLETGPDVWEDLLPS